MQRWIRIFLLIFTAAINLAMRPYAPSVIEINAVDVTYQFGEQATFTAQVTDAAAIQEAFLFIEPQGQNTRLEKITISPDGLISYTLDIQSNGLRPFTTVTYWFQLKLADGQDITSSRFRFEYEDNRFEWQRLANDQFTVSWIDGDLEFGQSAVNSARNGLESIRQILPAELPTPLKIFIYPSPLDMQEALKLTNTPWATGHASPDLGVIILSIPPGPDQRAEMERQIPHEMMHVLLYQITGNEYGQLPAWLVEGFASIAEIYPNPDYERVLQKNIQANSLLPLQSLCEAFPRDASGAFLAYAQSASFARFLYQNYGSSGLLKLIRQYLDGMGCSEAVTAAWDTPLSQLELRWQQETLGMNVGSLAFQKILPYLVIGLLMLIPIVITILLPRRTANHAIPENKG